MSNTYGILDGANFTDPNFDPEAFQLDATIGFLTRTQEPGKLTLLGFGANFVLGYGSTSETVVPVVDFGQLPDHLKTVEAQGKGVGPRLYNTKEGPASLKLKPKQVGIYTLTIARDELFDARPSQGSTWQRVAQQLQKIVAGRLRGAETIVRKQHDKYGDAGVVLLETPPQALGRLKLRGLSLGDENTSNFVIIRDPRIILRNVGESAVG